MCAKRATAAIRSGRFNVNDAAAGLDIIRSSSIVSYRILNGGENNFVVNYTGASPSVTPDWSLDFEAATVQITGAAGEKVLGVFDRIKPGDDIRSGRFKSTAGVTNIPIIQNRPNKLYRFFNTGDNPYTLNLNGTTVEVTANNSMDVYVTSNNPSVTVTSVNEVQGAYDALESGDRVRSGRFRFKEGVPPVNRPIIDLRLAPALRYRITNGGRRPFILRTAAGDLITLRRDQSIDLRLDAAATNLISVIATGNNHTITGIWDYLGTD
jgi:hypothetical protein